ncbi:hypothetical protein BC829DRAFT_9544 [Chytridium lagenaria]|nr:hypothetical protein BC829DRAFT_9544 [Chytridium lagenaria]
MLTWFFSYRLELLPFFYIIFSPIVFLLFSIFLLVLLRSFVCRLICFCLFLQSVSSLSAVYKSGEVKVEGAPKNTLLWVSKVGLTVAVREDTPYMRMTLRGHVYIQLTKLDILVTFSPGGMPKAFFKIFIPFFYIYYYFDLVCSFAFNAESRGSDYKQQNMAMLAGLSVGVGCLIIKFKGIAASSQYHVSWLTNNYDLSLN